MSTRISKCERVLHLNFKFVPYSVRFKSFKSYIINLKFNIKSKII